MILQNIIGEVGSVIELDDRSYIVKQIDYNISTDSFVSNRYTHSINLQLIDNFDVYSERKKITVKDKLPEVIKSFPDPIQDLEL